MHDQNPNGCVLGQDTRAEGNTFLNKYPEVEELQVTIQEAGNGTFADDHVFNVAVQTSSYSHHHLPEYIKCHNPRCHGEGLPLGEIIEKMIHGRIEDRKSSHFCGGREASPKGRKIYGSCYNRFRYHIEIQYKDILKG